MVSKLSPIRFGSRNVSRPVSHVPSPTCKVFEAYVLLPGGVRSELDDIILRLPQRSSSPATDDLSAFLGRRQDTGMSGRPEEI